MKIILAKLKDFKTPHFHYLMKIYDKNYEVFYHPLYFKIYTNSMLVNDTWINLHSKKYDCKMTFKGASVDLRGYIHGMPFLGRTSNWTLSE